MARSGLLEVYIRQQWCRVLVALNEESLTLTLEESPENPTEPNGGVEPANQNGNGSETNSPDQLPDSIAGCLETVVYISLGHRVQATNKC